jgi:hypothetical protein
MSLRGLFDFIGHVFLGSSTNRGRKLESFFEEKSEALMRGRLMRSARNISSPLSSTRALQAANVPLFKLDLDETLSITFDFNFGTGQKEVSLGLQFHFDSGDSVSSS